MHRPTNHCTRRGLAALLMTMLLALAACGSDDADTSIVSQQLASADGGVLSIDAASSPLRGLRVTVPAGALSGDGETITVRHKDELPGPLGDAMRERGMTPLTPVIVFERIDGSRNFAKPLLLRLPVAPSALDGHEVMAAVWDDASASWLPLEVLAVDRAAGHVHALIGHFSQVVVFGYEPQVPLSVNTGFDMAVHGFEHPNPSTVFDNGDCYGISSFALWHWRTKRSFGGGLYRRFGGGDGSFFGDEVVREVMAAAQGLSLPANRSNTYTLDVLTGGAPSDPWPLDPRTYPNPLPGFDPLTLQRDVGYRTIAQLQATGPQLLLLATSAVAPVFHAVLVIGFSADGAGGGSFFAYDPNLPHPAAPLVIRWSPLRGFGVLQHPNFGAMDRFWLTSPESWFRPAEMQAVDDAAEAGQLSNFRKFALLNVNLGGGVQACVVGQDTPDRCNLRISENTNPVAFGANPPKAYHLSAFNRTLLAPLLSGVPLNDEGNVAQSVVADTALLGTSASTIEMIVAAAADSASRIEAQGLLSRYRAFLKAQIKPARLGIGGQVTPQGYKLYVTLDGAPLPAGAGSIGTLSWKLGGVPVGQTENGTALILPTATPPAEEVEVEVYEGLGDVANLPRARISFVDRYDVTLTWRKVSTGTPINTVCNGIGCGLFCGVGGTEEGQVERFVDRWSVSQGGIATLTATGESGEETLTGTYVPATGDIAVGWTDTAEVTPEGSALRFFSDGLGTWDLRLDPDGSIRGTFTDRTTTRWSFDGRQVSCSKTADYVAIPLPR